MFKSLKTLLGLSLLAFFGVWMGCSSNASPVSPSNKAVTDDDGSATQVSTVTVSSEVRIPDDSLRVAVTQGLWDLSAAGKLDIPVGTNPLTTANLAKLETLYARGKRIANLEGLQYATNLKILYLEDNLIPEKGYSPLASLTKLTSLRIGGASNADIESAGLKAVVAGMPDLRDLKVNHMGLTDISFLEDLTELGYLNLNGNRAITSLKPLACLDKLYDLRVQRVDIAYNSVTGEFHPLILFLIGEGVSVDPSPS